MEHLLIWSVTVPVAILVFVIIFRRSVSKMISGIRLTKIAGAEFAQESDQQKKELEKKPLPNESPDRLRLVLRAPPIDPLIAKQMDVIRNDLNQQATDPSEREELLLQSVAIWQFNHKWARTARVIFGSQTELLQELNSKPQGESVDHLKKHYDAAALIFPLTYQNFSYAQYMNFLETQGLVLRIMDRVTLTPEGRAFLNYLVWTGDTMKKPN